MMTHRDHNTHEYRSTWIRTRFPTIHRLLQGLRLSEEAWAEVFNELILADDVEEGLDF